MSAKLSTLLSTNPVLAAELTKSVGLYLYDPVQSGADKSAGAVLSEIIKALISRTTSTNASGNTTITPGVLSTQHTEVTAVSGSAGTRVMILATSNTPIAGAIIRHRVTLPATADILTEWRNATSGGTLLTSHLSDGSGDDVFAQFSYDGSEWQFDSFTSPANA